MKRAGFMTLVSLTALAISASAGLARGGPDRAMPGFETLDQDGNGEITQSELNALGEARFAETDGNGDGTLDRAELIAAAVGWAEARATRMIERLDSNGDGVLSQDELTARRDTGRMISRFDSDGNGTLSQAEYDAGREKMRDRMAGHGHGKRHSD